MPEVFQSAEAVSLILVVMFFAYLGLIVQAYFRLPANTPGSALDFQWHFFVPCRDEEAVIGATIERLRTTFPAAHLWVIDDASDDRTPDIVSAAAARDAYVHLVRRFAPDARTGKGDALNSAYGELCRQLPAQADRTATIVGVVDADGYLSPNCLQHVASDTVMGDPNVGAAQLSVRMRNRYEGEPLPDKGAFANWFGRYLIRMQDIEFRTSIAAMQALRERTKSVGLGGNGQFTRLSVLDEIKARYGKPWHGALLEDYELGLHVMLTGYENRYINDTYVSQEALPDFRRLATQRTRWSQGNIQCIKYLPEILRSPHFTSAAVVEAGYYLLLPLFQLAGLLVWPLVIWPLILVFFFLAGSGSVDGVIEWFVQWRWLLALIVLVGIVPFAMWGPVYKIHCEPRVSWRKSFAWGIGMWLYVYYLNFTIPRAMYRIIRGKSGWAKTRRNAEDLTVGVTAKEA